MWIRWSRSDANEAEAEYKREPLGRGLAGVGRRGNCAPPNLNPDAVVDPKPNLSCPLMAEGSDRAVCSKPTLPNGAQEDC